MTNRLCSASVHNAINLMECIFLRCVLLKHLRSDYDVYGNKTMPHSTLAGIRVYQVNRMSSVVCWVGFHLRSINLIA